jgi:small subunit ribosomal protein S11
MGKKKVVEQTGTETAKETPVVAPLKTSAARKAKRIAIGRVYINSSYNNTVITVTDERGDVVTWASAGSIGFSGPKKATPFAASKIVAVIAEKLKNLGVSNIEVVMKGVGGGRDSAARSLVNQGFNILSLKDATPVPHNGPRPRKVRRV